MQGVFLRFSPLEIHGMTGAVYLVGAGPGDPSLITVRGLELVREADVILYDALLDKRLLDEAPLHCERIYVGKRAGSHAMTQEAINGELVRHARAGKRVVRLKGGDPMIFGRATEEIRALRDAGLNFEVIPGVTASAAAAAVGGFSLTERHIASAVVFVTGHECAGKISPAVRWSDYAALGATLCIYMGAQASERIAAELLAAGLSPDLPTWAASAVSHPGETARLGTLAALARGEQLAGLATPVVLVIGEVAREAGAASTVAAALQAA